jgi:dephospho-CoA kinase
MKIVELLENINVTEGVHDPAIFKVVFIIGGPGSGKSRVAHMLALKSLGFVSVNSDEAFSHLLKKSGLNLKMPPEEEAQRSSVRARAKEITANKMQLALDGRLGIVIDGTGEDYRKIEGIHANLSEMGYESFLVVVYANLETAKRRNAARERSVPEHVVEKKWYGVQQNLDNFLTMFDNSVIIDNNGTVSDLTPQTEHAYKMIARWSRVKSSSPEAQNWINDQLGNDDDDDVEDDDVEDDDVEDEDIPEPEDEVTDEPVKEGYYKNKVIAQQELMNKQTGQWPTVDNAVSQIKPKFWNVEINGKIWKKWREPVKIPDSRIDRVIDSIRGPQDVVKKIPAKS